MKARRYHLLTTGTVRWLPTCRIPVLACALATLPAAAPELQAQPLFTPWGNLPGIRVPGRVVPFETSLRVVRPDWSGFTTTVKYLQQPKVTANGARWTVSSRVDEVAFEEALEEVAPGSVAVSLRLTAEKQMTSAGVYLCLDLPVVWGDGFLDFGTNATPDAPRLALPVARKTSDPNGDRLRTTAQEFRVQGPGGDLRLTVQLARPAEFIVRRDACNRPTELNDPLARQTFVVSTSDDAPTGYQIYISLMPANAAPGQVTQTKLVLTAAAPPDDQPLELTVEPTRPGPAFAGIGGNFRLQFPQTDPEVIRYNLDNLRLAWGRVELPWREWDPEEADDPLASARAGRLHERVKGAMEMARTLTRRGIPVIVSAWFPPSWARAASQPAGLRGTALDNAKLDRICDSLASYVQYLKERFGTETALLSLNEPEIGVEVRQTPAEHAAFVQSMGEALAGRSLSTKVLLGDTAHCTPTAFEFLQPSLNRPELHRYVGGLAYHTWRGCTGAQLRQWSAVARQLQVPLLVTEAGLDAHLHEYPSIMLTPAFALQEIELYVKVCALGGPTTVMHWQLTADYSLLEGAGIYGGEARLRPTQRFWNLKQLALTPPGAFALPVSSDRSGIAVAAFGDLARDVYAIHIVNPGATRRATVRGLPPSVQSARPFTTDARHGMAEGAPVPVKDRVLELTLTATSYTTLLTAPPSP